MSNTRCHGSSDVSDAATLRMTKAVKYSAERALKAREVAEETSSEGTSTEHRVQKRRCDHTEGLATTCVGYTALSMSMWSLR